METVANDCWFLTGPTAIGKTRVALTLAEHLNAEIISLDSMAIYRGMYIGTAKPGREQRQQVRHYLIDIIDPVARYMEDVERAIGHIQERGREVLFVGGTPLYLKSLLRGIFEGPPADWDFRQQIESELDTIGSRALHERLAALDPLTADKLHHSDTRRMIRALEVYRATGQPISHLQLQFEEGRAAEECNVFVLDRPRPEVHERINARVDEMFRQGLVGEVRNLTAGDRRLGRTASQAVGYREVIAHLEGETTLEDAIDRVKTRTRRFAKRQGTWFRSLSECRFVPINDTDSAEEVIERIMGLASGS